MAAKMALGIAAVAQGITRNQLIIDAGSHDVGTQSAVWGWDGRQVTRGKEEDADTIFNLADVRGHGRRGISNVNCLPARMFRGGWTTLI